MKFEDLNINASILKALNEKKYTTATPIQSKAIPLALAKNDILGIAQTGTGKTAAFAIPTIQHLIAADDQSKKKVIKALILTPTRELAIQIQENFTEFSKYTSLRNTVIFGGVNQASQVRVLKNGIDILIATPGRLMDLMNQGFISLKHIEFFILDEADRMLDMGFVHEVKKLVKIIPQKRQSLFFSATMPDSIKELSNSILSNPKKVEVSPTSSTADTIQQYIYMTNKSSKKDLLFHILKDEKLDQVLLFSKTKHGADRIVKNLKKENITAAAIHGDKAQNQRQKALINFKEGNIRVLVATDIAARGIDIDQLKYVINYDIPNISETYVHRIGRSGRAGKEGTAISLCEPEENAYLKSIEKLIKKKVEVIKDNPYPQTDKPMTAAQKKEAEKEKQRRKQEFFANRKASKNTKGGSNKRNQRR